MKKFNKSYLALGLMALVVVSAVGISSASMAATSSDSSINTKTNVSEVKSNIGVRNFKHLKKNSNWVANQAAREARKTAINAALKANDYNAWVTAVGPNAPILQKINASKFNRFVEAYNLRQQAQTIMTELGVNKGEGKGMGDKDMGQR